MLDVLRARLQQRHRTMRYPDGPPPALPDRFRGRPVIDAPRCAAGLPAVRGGLPDRRACAPSADGAAPRPGPLPLLRATARRPARPGPSRFTRRLPPGRRAPRGPGRPAPADRPRRAAATRAAARLFGRSLQAAPGQRRRLQRLRGRHQRAEHGRLGPGPVRHPVRGLAAPRRRPAGHRARSRANMRLALREDLRGRARRPRS